MCMKVVLFAAARDAVGAHEVEVNETPRTVGDLRAVLHAQFPSLQRVLLQSRMAVNERFVDEDFVLHSTSDVAVIPPVAGG
jgi:molybdopterin converting factor subunit 1